MSHHLRVEWNFYLPDSDRNSGFSNHTYCLQYVCSGYGDRPETAWAEAKRAQRVPDGFNLPQSLTAIRALAEKTVEAT